MIGPGFEAKKQISVFDCVLQSFAHRVVCFLELKYSFDT